MLRRDTHWPEDKLRHASLAAAGRPLERLGANCGDFERSAAARGGARRTWPRAADSALVLARNG